VQPGAPVVKAASITADGATLTVHGYACATLPIVATFQVASASVNEAASAGRAAHFASAQADFENTLSLVQEERSQLERLNPPQRLHSLQTKLGSAAGYFLSGVQLADVGSANASTVAVRAGARVFAQGTPLLKEAAGELRQILGPRPACSATKQPPQRCQTSAFNGQGDIQALARCSAARWQRVASHATATAVAEVVATAQAQLTAVARRNLAATAVAQAHSSATAVAQAHSSATAVAQAHSAATATARRQTTRLVGTVLPRPAKRGRTSQPAPAAQPGKTATPVPTRLPVRLAHLPSKAVVHYGALLQRSALNRLFGAWMALHVAARGVQGDPSVSTTALVDDASALLKEADKSLATLRPPTRTLLITQRETEMAVRTFFAAARHLRLAVIERGAGNAPAAHDEVSSAKREVKRAHRVMSSTEQRLSRVRVREYQVVGVLCCARGPHDHATELTSKPLTVHGPWTIEWTSSCTSMLQGEKPALSIRIFDKRRSAPVTAIQVPVTTKGLAQGSYTERHGGTFSVDVTSTCLSLVVAG
jgi:hypothetical protein